MDKGGSVFAEQWQEEKKRNICKRIRFVDSSGSLLYAIIHFGCNDGEDEDTVRSLLDCECVDMWAICMFVSTFQSMWWFLVQKDQWSRKTSVSTDNARLFKCDVSVSCKCRLLQFCGCGRKPHVTTNLVRMVNGNPKIELN